jgi:adenylate cyclase
MRKLSLLGGGAVQRLPARIRDAIRTQEDETERLIGWIQLAVVVTFGTLYLVSPKTASAAQTFHPVPWALSVYLALTVGRIVWATRGRLPGWSLAASIVIDMTLLMVLIWSFHLQYGQPASFYLKAPTLLYVFIFIALRALRFDALYVLLAGLVAALWWLGLVYYAFTVDPRDTMITRNYVEYLTSNSILVGAEFDKVISILTVTGVLVVALVRGRRLLIRAVSESLAAQELSRFFAPEIARHIKGAEQQIRAGTGEVRDAAILNLDLRGFTRLAQSMAPADVMTVLGEYQGRMAPIIRRHGGSIDKFMGDGIMATFGAVRSSETFAADALAALDEVMADAARWREDSRAAGRVPLEVGGAVATGRVIFGAVGDQTRLEYTVIGDSVNLAAKLEKHNKAEGVRALAPWETYALALRQGYRPTREKERRSGRCVAGVGRPVDLAVLAA